MKKLLLAGASTLALFTAAPAFAQSNSSMVTQNGASNQATIGQSGSNANSTVSQLGNGNLVTVTQSGNGAKATVNQGGTPNAEEQSRFGLANAPYPKQRRPGDREPGFGRDGECRPDRGRWRTQSRCQSLDHAKWRCRRLDRRDPPAPEWRRDCDHRADRRDQ